MNTALPSSRRPQLDGSLLVEQLHVDGANVLLDAVLERLSAN